MIHKITIKIRTGNAAFRDGDHENYETARILRVIADRLEHADWMISSIDDEPLMDIHGNRVGSIVVKHR